MAQLGRALGSGLRGRAFESRHPDSLAGAPEGRVFSFPGFFNSECIDSLVMWLCIFKDVIF